jgi:hypothetical protein
MTFWKMPITHRYICIYIFIMYIIHKLIFCYFITLVYSKLSWTSTVYYMYNPHCDINMAYCNFSVLVCCLVSGARCLTPSTSSWTVLSMDVLPDCSSCVNSWRTLFHPTTLRIWLKQMTVFIHYGLPPY